MNLPESGEGTPHSHSFVVSCLARLSAGKSKKNGLPQSIASTSDDDLFDDDLFVSKIEAVS
jgi:hypothetical protein